MGTTPSLDLSTLVPDRITIRIESKLNPDGRLYELRKSNEMSVEQLQFVSSLGEKAEALESKGIAGLSPEEARLLDDWTREILSLVMYTELESEVHDALNQEQRLAILNTFTETFQPPAQPTNRATKRAKKTPTGAK